MCYSSVRISQSVYQSVTSYQKKLTRNNQSASKLFIMQNERDFYPHQSTGMHGYSGWGYGTAWWPGRKHSSTPTTTQISRGRRRDSTQLSRTPLPSEGDASRPQSMVVEVMSNDACLGERFHDSILYILDDVYDQVIYSFVLVYITTTTTTTWICF